jgi:NAD(P)-dependent dehydrogenase (short-subunit alcohol dehydrogenase family)
MASPDISTSAPRAIYPDLKGKVAIVTGIGQVGDQSMWGNGAAYAMTLARNGVKVLGCDLKLASAEHTQKRILADREVEESGGSCAILECDVTKSEQVKRLVDEAMKISGSIDILINNVRYQHGLHRG